VEVKPGYKQTEVGVIPDEWGTVRLADVSAFITKGSTPTTYGFGWQSSGVLFLRSECVSPEGLDLAQSMFISTEAHRTLRRSTVHSNDLLITITGNVGRVVKLPEGLGEANINQHIARIRIVDESTHAGWVYHFLSQPVVRRHFEKITTGQAYPQISLVQVRDAVIPRPVVAEQRAIAAALGDVDALLGGLDRLIAKKRGLKQAAMQQLLTGQTRLPGFSGEWEVKRLGDHVTFLRNGVNSRAELLPEGRVRYLHYGDIHASADSFLSPQTMPSLPDAKAARLDRLRDGDLIFADASEDIAGVCKSVELRDTRDTEVVSGLHTIAARFDKTVLADGFKGFLQYCPSFAAHLRRLAAGTKVYATNRAHIATVEMRLPSVNEQTAIAAVLSDMDAELTALEARRDKTRDLKQAMMQELLTGRTRLV
jgi:type I restriction enzyme S subunit